MLGILDDRRVCGGLVILCRDFSSPKGVSAVADPYGDTRKKFLGWLSGDPRNPNDMGQIGKSGPTYGGEITAPMTGQEEASLSKLDEYGKSSLKDNSSFQSAKNFTNNYLNDSFDPSTSPYYQAIKAQAATNLNDTNNQIASDAAGGGRYWTGARLKQQGRASTAVNENLNTTLAGLQQQNTQNKIGLLPQALTMADTEQNYPAMQASVLQQLGALPRNLKQNTDTAKLNEFYKSQYDYPLSIASLIAGVQQPPVYQQNPNSWSQNATQAGVGLGSAAIMAAILM